MSHPSAIITTELGLRVTSKAGFEWMPDFHVYIRDCFASDVTTRVSLVTKDLMKDRVGYRLAVLFHPVYEGVVAKASVMTCDSYVYQTVRPQLWMQW